MRLNRRKFLSVHASPKMPFGILLAVQRLKKDSGFLGVYPPRRWEEKYRPDFNKLYWRVRAVNRYFVGELR